MIEFLKYIVDSFGLWGIFLILAIEGLGIPFPTQIAYLGAVALLNSHKFTPFTLIMVISLGNLCGNVIVNLLLRSGRKRIISFFERLLRIKKETLESVNSFFVKYGIFAVPVARILGVPRTPVIFLAGISKINFYEYIISSFIGNTIWATFYVYFYWYGFSFFKFLYKKDINLFWLAISVLVFIVILVWTIFLNLWRRRRRKRV
ncbi:membrane protein DedA with SNARE-associated domain [Caldicellulosiruptor bescii]|uniref:SNARE associated Golgi protein n=2 Tax=Caldicellulosiruptor bescii TaxID=31899 RepID=B9MNY1_CALBD|nr:VTT domain-containing protein [Caldicellulosiruptor bescii]ACM59660.1 SNARE associated Golgi protein [Caldicellulosiruptor bescii DSM 6725]PBC89685.1 membrane protein DedA with SNARE-associated domain [Caldicellulosiruptor bescii]PBC90008.1 membrane protein DedA with SNARE-associated domain [Caldicellulosiruptor bescii]PBD04561.1 membrane protein DedA with SNARE-associated domain [Caldicellulosiruptor bescii]PBD05805.1 membrane protein DedA with SNARE-associated domain [Caldicellulosiruptor